MFDDRQATGCGNDPCRGRDIDRSGEIPSGSAAVREQTGRRGEWTGGSAQRFGGADQLLRRLALDPKRDKGRGHQRLA